MRIITKALILSLLGGLLFVGTAYAHAAYLRSNPGADAIVAAAPERVEIWFKQELFRRKGDNAITVTNADGQTVSVGDALVDDDDRKHLWVAMQPNLAPGLYTVAWKNLSFEDGHPAEGMFSFMVDPQAKETSTPMGVDAAPTSGETPSATATPNPSPTATLPVKSTPTGLPCAASLIPLLVLGGLVLRPHNRS